MGCDLQRNKIIKSMRGLIHSFTKGCDVVAGPGGEELVTEVATWSHVIDVTEEFVGW